MKNAIYLLIAICLIACTPKPENSSTNETQNTSIDQQSIRKIDVHTHYRYPRAYLPELFKKWNMQSVLVDVAKADSTGIRRSWEPYLAHAKTHPDLFYLCSSLIGVGIDDPDFAQKAIEQLNQEIEAGARMVKVWKNFGMVTKDTEGNFIQIDDERLKPIWKFLISKGVPVMAHIAEPIQAWRPLDPKNPHYWYYSNHPEYHAYNIPEIPSYETIIAARDNWIESNPELQILCAHLGSMSHDVDMVAERLDKYPNISVELGARFGDLAMQNSEKLSAFFKKYKDRIMFGSDYNNSAQEETLTESKLKEEQSSLEERYDILWKYLSSTDSMEVRRQQTKGLGLSKEILKKVYYQNTANFLKLSN
ncbi:MAG: amidohydrolase family protein [Cyclobacteriaceae bacterium]